MTQTTITNAKLAPGFQIYPRELVNGDSPTKQDCLKTPCHPLDQLSEGEICLAAKLVREYKGDTVHLKFNCITLREPKKEEYTAFRSKLCQRPHRKAFVIVLELGTPYVIEAVVNLTRGIVDIWSPISDVAPILTPEDFEGTERICRQAPDVINACREIGITDMSKVYFDGWAIGHDDRWETERRLQQALAYYRSSEFDNQYAHPLDFAVVLDTELGEVLSVDVRLVNGKRTPPPMDNHNYMPEFISGIYKPERIKPIDITQPQGPSFQVNNNEISWMGFKMHVGFNFREGIVISNVRVDDPYEDSHERMLFYRISVVEMVVPYGSPESPQNRKCPFDAGEYGAGLMANSLKLGCDCKGTIHYLNGIISLANGQAAIIKNAICIHEEDNGLLFKHTDDRDGSFIVARDRKLVISQIITASNYEYAFYHTFSLDGTYKLEVKLTGILSTYSIHPTEIASPFGVEVAPGITAQNHQHIFSLRVDPEIDGCNNSIIQNDAVPIEEPVGSASNLYGNGFYCKQTLLRTTIEGAASYCHETSRTWDIVNPNRLHAASKKPVGYKIVNSQCPPLLAQPSGIVWKRAAFAREALFVTPYRDYQLYPAGNYVCQSLGTESHPYNPTIADWVAHEESIENRDIVCYIQFGVTHFPRPEDFPIMPAETVSVMMRACNFFERNPALWVPPSNLTLESSSSLAFGLDSSS